MNEKHSAILHGNCELCCPPCHYRTHGQRCVNPLKLCLILNAPQFCTTVFEVMFHFNSKLKEQLNCKIADFLRR